MKPVRVDGAVYTVGGLRCPACGAPARGAVSGVGVIRMRCRRKNRGRLEPGCHREWDALRLPPGTTGAQLLALYGSDVAIAVHRELCPESDGCSADTLAAWIMPIPATTATYLQRLALSAEPEPELGWSRAQSILATLFRISA